MHPYWGYRGNSLHSVNTSTLTQILSIGQVLVFHPKLSLPVPAMKWLKIHFSVKLNGCPFDGNGNVWLNCVTMQFLITNPNVKFKKKPRNNPFKVESSVFLVVPQAVVDSLSATCELRVIRKQNFYITVLSFALTFGKCFSKLFEFSLSRYVIWNLFIFWFSLSCNLCKLL